MATAIAASRLEMLRIFRDFVTFTCAQAINGILVDELLRVAQLSSLGELEGINAMKLTPRERDGTQIGPLMFSRLGC